MATEAQINANRRNSKASTGPKSLKGKASVASNALRHGLAVPISDDRQFDDIIERLAVEICGSDRETRRLNAARRIAEAQADLHRIREARSLLLRDPIHHQKRRLREVVKSLIEADSEEDGSKADILAYLGRGGVDFISLELPADIGFIATRLNRIDRYEKRALARRRIAIEQFDEINQFEHKMKTIPVSGF